MKNKKVLIAILIISALLMTAVFGAGIIIAQSSSKHFRLHSMLKSFKYGFKTKNHKNWSHKKFSKNSKVDWLSENLNKAVKDGKITEQQKQVILVKNAEMLNKMKAVKASGGNWQEIKRLKKDFMKWAEENNIDLNDIWQKDKKWKKHGKWKKGGRFNNFHKNKPGGASI